MPEEKSNDDETVDNALERISVWDFPPTWFGCGVGTMMGAALGGAGGNPWYRAPLVILAGFCVAIAMLLHMRKKTPS